MIHNRDELKECRQKAKADMETAACRILVCSGTGCIATGSEKIYNRFLKLANITPGVSVIFAPHDEDTHIGLKKTGCQGFCELGPLVRITKNDETVQYVKVQLDDCQELFERAVLGDEVVERLLYRKEKKVYRHPKEIPFIAKQTRIVLENCGRFDAESIDEYMASGGFSALEKAMFEMTSEEVIEEIDKSGLRGRGGGGFPTGRKWKQVAHQKEKVRYVVCNGDEGDPGAFMDGSVMEGDPFKLIEGMMIAAYAVESSDGYIYVRAEYPLAIKRLRTAIAQAEEMGLLGEHIFESDFSFTIHIKEGAGAFVCGEETALMASIEGKRGMPRPRPPFPAVSGLWGKPTNINNVETFANVAQIIVNGADWYCRLGTEKSKGTKVFALTGKINNTGLAEVPMGITMREIIYDIGGGITNGKKFKAVQIGGPSGGCLPESMLDLPVDYDSLIAAGAMMGSGGLVVMDEDTCMVDVAKFFLNFTQSESCGKCTPCREGTKRMLEILTRITEGQGREGDIELLENLAKNIKETALCGLGQTAPNPVLSTLKYFRDEYEAHIKEKRCPAGVCEKMLHYEISDVCRGCGLCARQCPVQAISGSPKTKHVIDQNKCIKCGACMTACPFKAISKA